MIWYSLKLNTNINKLLSFYEENGKLLRMSTFAANWKEDWEIDDDDDGKEAFINPTLGKVADYSNNTV